MDGCVGGTWWFSVGNNVENEGGNPGIIPNNAMRNTQLNVRRPIKGSAVSEVSKDSFKVSIASNSDYYYVNYIAHGKTC